MFKIVLLGSIPKGDEVRREWVDWKTEYTQKLNATTDGITFLDGDLISDNVGPELVVGHDLWLIKHADLAIVDAPKKIGAGTAQEMVIAKSFKKPIVTILPKDSHHRRSNVVFDKVTVEDWIHPFLYVASDYIAESIDEAIPWIQEYIISPADKSIKDINIFNEVIQQFETELPEMYEAYKERGW